MNKLVPIVIVFILLLTGCSNSKYTEISYKKFMDMIDNKESFVLVVGAKSCHNCDNYKLTMNQIIKDYKVKIYYIDIEKMADKEHSKFLTVINFSSTPTTVFIEKGKENSTYNRLVGDKSYDKIVDKLTKNGYIKGDK